MTREGSPAAKKLVEEGTLEHLVDIGNWRKGLHNVLLVGTVDAEESTPEHQVDTGDTKKFEEEEGTLEHLVDIVDTNKKFEE